MLTELLGRDAYVTGQGRGAHVLGGRTTWSEVGLGRRWLHASGDQATWQLRERCVHVDEVAEGGVLPWVKVESGEGRVLRWGCDRAG